jgi:hypothetical protein
MLEWLRTNDVRWVVKAGEYSVATRKALNGLEAEGILRPVAAAQMEDFAGWRIAGEKINVVIQIMEVRQPAP